MLNYESFITTPERVIFPSDKISKLDVINYYKKVYPYAIHLLKNKSLVIKRFPQGIDKQEFIQRHATDYFPDDIKTKKSISIKNIISFVKLANMAVVEISNPLGKINSQIADSLVLDLDPPKNGFKLAREGAHELKGMLDKMKIKSYLMTTGKEGLHIYVPLKPIYTFDEVRGWTKKLFSNLVESNPNKYTIKSTDNGRTGKLFLDYARNGYNQAMIAPYSLRAIPGAPIAMPISWEELNKISSAKHFTYFNISQNLRGRVNPWKNYSRIKNILPEI